MPTYVYVYMYVCMHVCHMHVCMYVEEFYVIAPQRKVAAAHGLHCNSAKPTITNRHVVVDVRQAPPCEPLQI